MKTLCGYRSVPPQYFYYCLKIWTNESKSNIRADPIHYLAQKNSRRWSYDFAILKFLMQNPFLESSVAVFLLLSCHLLAIQITQKMAAELNVCIQDPNTVWKTKKKKNLNFVQKSVFFFFCLWNLCVLACLITFMKLHAGKQWLQWNEDQTTVLAAFEMISKYQMISCSVVPCNSLKPSVHFSDNTFHDVFGYKAL